MITRIIPKLPFIDKQQTIDFYVEKIGFTLRSDYGDYLIMDLGNVELHFFSYPTLAPSKSDFMVYLRVDSDIETLYEKCSHEISPAKCLARLEAKPWRQKEFSLGDPNGTLLTFGQPY